MLYPHYVVKSSEDGNVISHYHPPASCQGCGHCADGVRLDTMPHLLNSDAIPGILFLTGWTDDSGGSDGEQASV